MSVHDVKIVVLDTPKCSLDQYRNDFGELAICVPRGIDFEIVKDSQQASDLEKLTSDYSTSFDIPIDNRTRNILKNVHYRIVKGVSVFRAVLMIGDIVHLDGYMNINASIEKMTSNIVSYTVQLIGTHQTWKDTLRNNCLQNLELGSITWNYDTIQDLCENNDIYEDGAATVYPLLADFGQFFNEAYEYVGFENDVSIYDFRILVYRKAILDAMFNLAGYRVVSRFADSERFRKEADYLLRPDFYDIYSEGEDRVNARVSLSADQTALQTYTQTIYSGDTIRFDVVETDSNGNWNLLEYRYINTTSRPISDIKVKMSYEVCNTTPSNMVLLPHVYVLDDLNNEIFYIVATDVYIALLSGQCINYENTVDIGQAFRDNFVTKGYLPTGWKIEIRLYWTSGLGNTDAPIISAGGYAEFYVGGKHWYENDLIPINRVLTCNHTLYDILLDYRKTYNLRFATDEANKIVYIEPSPDRYVQYQTYTEPEKQVKGFSASPNDVRQVWDLTDQIDICQEIRKSFDVQDNYNSIRFKFKDTTDSHPDYEPYKIKDNSLWSKVVYTDNNNTDKALEIELSIFEPTLNGFVPRISFEPQLGYRAIYIPLMYDSEPEETEIGTSTPPLSGTNYEPRAFHVFGWVTQFGTDTLGVNQSRRWTFEGLTQVYVPTVAQALPPTMQIQPQFTPLQPIINNIFGDNVFNTYEKDYVTTFYSDIITETQEGIELNLSIRITSLQFKCLTTDMIARIFSEQLPLIHLNNYYTIKKVVMRFNTVAHATITLVPKITC